MQSVFVQESQTGEILGNFEFLSLPRKGDDISVPWPGAEFDTRCLVVDEVTHIAEGVGQIVGFGTGPLTIVKGEEVT